MSRPMSASAIPIQPAPAARKCDGRRAGAYTRAMLGLPDGVTALLFDLDGVLTDTASVHQRAWKEMFDDYLRERDGSSFKEFPPRDYEQYVDGKPRYEGVASFLESRGIDPV